MKAQKRNTSPLFHFSLSFFLILIIPIAMGIFHFGYMMDTATQQNVYTNTLILKNSMDALEGSLRSIFTYSRTLNQMKVLDDIISTEDRESISLLDLQNAAISFPLMRENNRYVDIYFLYSSRNGMILAPSQAFINVEMYYGSYFDFGDMPFDTWSEQVLNNAGRQNGVFLLPLEGGEELLMYQTPYVSQRDGKVAGQQIYVLDNNRIYNALSPAFQMGAGFLYIEDNRGNLLVAMEQEGWTARSMGPMGEGDEGSVEQRIDGRDVVATYCRSPEYGWTYVIAVPKSTLMATAMGSVQMTLVATVFLTLAGVVLILGVYRYNKNPLMNLVQYVAPHSAGEAPLRRRNQNGLWQLTGSITSLVSDKSRIEAQLAQQQEALRQSFLVQLVTGQILDEERITAFLRSCGIEAPYVRMQGSYLKILSREIAEGTQVKAVIQQAVEVESAQAKVMPCFWMDNRHLTLLCLQWEDAPTDACTELLRSIHFQLMDQWGLETVFSLGAECGVFSEVHLSFEEAKNLLVSGGDVSPILRASERNPAHRENFLYSAREEGALLEMAGAGRFQEVKGLLGKIRRTNFSERRLSPAMREMLFYKMASTLLCAGWDVEFPLHQMSLSSMDTEDFFALLEAQYSQACARNARLRQERHEKMQGEIVRYIDENFRDPSMGLSALSQRFGVTESYLSTLIKSLVGENFSSYLEFKRIDEANRLLRNGDQAVGEVGRYVGYDSATSFSRAYKRVMGHSPSQYLKLHNGRGRQEDDNASQ